MKQKTLMRRLRWERDLTIAEVGLRTGIAPSTLSQIERRLMRPTEEQRAKLAKFFGVPEDKVLSVPSSQAVA